MSGIETAILKRVMLEASRLGATVWRNNVGAYKDKTGRLVTYGVCNPGGADLIGIYKGRFLAIEVKAPGNNPTGPQRRFLDHVERSGGIAIVCDDEKNLASVLNAL